MFILSILVVFWLTLSILYVAICFNVFGNDWKNLKPVNQKATQYCGLSSYFNGNSSRKKKSLKINSIRYNHNYWHKQILQAITEECYDQEERQEEEGICYWSTQRRKHIKYVDMKVEGKISIDLNQFLFNFTGN